VNLDVGKKKNEERKREMQFKQHTDFVTVAIVPAGEFT
jgi:hypothetical protein